MKKNQPTRGDLLTQLIRTPLLTIKAVQTIAPASRRAPKQREKAVQSGNRIGRNSLIGAIVLLILSVVLLVISYLYPNIVAEVDSVVAFAAALVLFYKDTTHSVQLRVVDRILDSSRAEVSQLASLTKFSSQDYYIHELRGEEITDVFVVRSPSSSSQSEERDGAMGKADNDHQRDIVALIPPGRSLAKLFMRELAKESPNLEDLSNAMQPIFSESLGLSFASSMEITSADSISVKIVQPVLKSPCVQEGSPEGSHAEYPLVCVTCSLLAVLICYAAKRPVSIMSCYNNPKQNITTIEYRLEPLY